ncbi:hypothetical protein ANCDUO_22743 [Ancylostoma duodenale]|uniref:Proteasome activator complex subunit 4 C-terminal domain-containing protein n=1 Tax=Ancylostoma duodenale TaxID=51022 RepID=A0A0C2CBH5_9BILA|nr:hypothetical protein ANCDUO_22743 [Ancylostoma duodenale]
MNNDFKGVPKRFHVESIDFWLQRFEGNLGETASNRSGIASAQGSETSLLAQRGAGLKVDEVPGDAGLKMEELAAKLAEASVSGTSIDVTKEVKYLPQAQNYLRTLLEFLLQYYEDSITCLTPGIVTLFPVLLDYANEEDAEWASFHEEISHSDFRVMGSYKDMDIKYSASLLIHDYMSSLLLTPNFADSFVNSFYTSYMWRAKVSVLKFIQALVFSNIYEMERGGRPAKVTRLLFDAIIDRQMEVRTEASRSMLTLILCNYIKVDENLFVRYFADKHEYVSINVICIEKFLQKYLDGMMKSKNIASLHGAILGMGAAVRAHPYSTPPTIKPMLKALCGVTSHNAELQCTRGMTFLPPRNVGNSYTYEWTYPTDTLLITRDTQRVPKKVLPVTSATPCYFGNMPFCLLPAALSYPLVTVSFMQPNWGLGIGLD